MEEEWEECQMTAWVDRWKAQALNPCQLFSLSRGVEDRPVYTEAYDLAADTLAIGDVFVVIARAKMKN